MLVKRITAMWSALPPFPARFNRVFSGYFLAILPRVSASFSIVVLGTLVGFALRFALARAMTVEAYGQYAYAVSWSVILVVPAIAGWDTASVRFSASYWGQAETTLLQGYWWHSYRWVTLSTLAVGLLTLVGVWLLRDTLGNNLVPTFMLMGLMVVAQAFLQVTTRNLLAFKNVLLGLGPLNLFIKLGLIAGAIVIWAVVRQPLAAPTVMTVHLLATLALLLIAAYWFLRRLPARPTRAVRVPKKEKDEWNRTALQLSFLAGLRVISQQADTAVLGLLLGTTEAGIYVTGAIIASLISFGLLSLNTVVSPLIAEQHAKGNLTELQRLLSVSAIGIAAYVLPASFVIMLFGKPILRLFDPEFVAGYSPLLILIIGQVANSLFGSVGSLMTMTGRQKTATLILGISSFANLLLSVVLIPLLGLVGAAWAKTLSLVVWNVMMYVYVKRTMGVDPTLLSFLTSTRSSEETNG